MYAKKTKKVLNFRALTAYIYCMDKLFVIILTSPVIAFAVAFFAHLAISLFSL